MMARPDTAFSPPDSDAGEPVRRRPWRRGSRWTLAIVVSLFGSIALHIGFRWGWGMTVETFLAVYTNWGFLNAGIWGLGVVANVSQLIKKRRRGIDLVLFVALLLALVVIIANALIPVGVVVHLVR